MGSWGSGYGRALLQLTFRARTYVHQPEGRETLELVQLLIAQALADSAVELLQYCLRDGTFKEGYLHHGAEYYFDFRERSARHPSYAPYTFPDLCLVRVGVFNDHREPNVAEFVYHCEPVAGALHGLREKAPFEYSPNSSPSWRDCCDVVEPVPPVPVNREGAWRLATAPERAQPKRARGK